MVSRTRPRNPRSGRKRAEHRVVLAIFPAFQMLDLSGPHEVFAAANDALEERGRAFRRYRLEVVAPAAGVVASSSGLAVTAGSSLDEVAGPIDTLLVVGGRGTREALADPAWVPFMKRAAAASRRVCSVCTGTFLLAEAGLLAGRRATTHWNACDRLAARYPDITVEADPIYVHDGRFWTSAGVTSGMDLALALVEADHGRDVSLEVARRLVLFLKRPGGQSQFSAQLRSQLASREPLRDLQAYIAEHPDGALDSVSLARRVAMSPRHFARVFTEEVGETPARFVERTRVEAARRMLEESNRGVEEIAAGCGFGSAETMRRAFLRQVGVGPADYRSRFQVLDLGAQAHEGRAAAR